jgi:hypothetical protein
MKTVVQPVRLRVQQPRATPWVLSRIMCSLKDCIYSSEIFLGIKFSFNSKKRAGIKNIFNYHIKGYS